MLPRELLRPLAGSSRLVAPTGARHAEAKVTPQTIDPVTLDDLKRRASARAADLGHRLEPFRTARHDPLCYVSFCAACRQMVIISLQKAADDQTGGLYGYALEAPCAASSGGPRSEVASAHAH